MILFNIIYLIQARARSHRKKWAKARSRGKSKIPPRQKQDPAASRIQGNFHGGEAGGAIAASDISSLVRVPLCGQQGRFAKFSDVLFCACLCVKEEVARTTDHI